MSQRVDNGTNLSGRKEDEVGVEFPYIRIHDYILSKGEILSFKLESSDFLPTIELKFEVGSATFEETNKINVGDRIQVGKRADLKYFRAISGDFLVDRIVHDTPSHSENDGDGYFRYYLVGHLWVPLLFTDLPEKKNFYGTAEEALMDIAKQLGLGYVENTNHPDCQLNHRTSTTQKETWRGEDNPYEYIKYITKRMFVGPDSFFDTWIDFYYNLTNVNVGDMLGRKIEDDGTSIFTKFRSVVETSASDGAYASNDADTDKYFKDNKLLMNERSAMTSVWYVTDYKIINRANEIALKYSTKKNVSVYIQNNGVEQGLNTAIKSVNIGVFYNYDKIKVGYTTLNGPTDYDKNFQTADNGSWLDQTTSSEIPIVMPIKSDGDDNNVNGKNDNSQASGNVSKGYVIAPYHNEINLAELEKQNVVVHTNGFNNGISKGEKVPCFLLKNSTEKWLSETREIPDNTFLFSPIASGWFYVKGVAYIYTPSANPDKSLSDWQTEITLTRREWFPPEATTTAMEAGDTQNASLGNEVFNQATGGPTTLVKNVVNPDQSLNGDKKTLKKTVQKVKPNVSNLNLTKLDDEFNKNKALQDKNRDALIAMKVYEDTQKMTKNLQLLPLND